MDELKSSKMATSLKMNYVHLKRCSKLTDDSIKNIDAITAEKEQELLEV